VPGEAFRIMDQRTITQRRSKGGVALVRVPSWYRMIATAPRDRPRATVATDRPTTTLDSQGCRKKQGRSAAHRARQERPESAAEHIGRAEQQHELGAVCAETGRPAVRAASVQQEPRSYSPLTAVSSAHHQARGFGPGQGTRSRAHSSSWTAPRVTEVTSDCSILSQNRGKHDKNLWSCGDWEDDGGAMQSPWARVILAASAQQRSRRSRDGWINATKLSAANAASRIRACENAACHSPWSRACRPVQQDVGDVEAVVVCISHVRIALDADVGEQPAARPCRRPHWRHQRRRGSSSDAAPSAKLLDVVANSTRIAIRNGLHVVGRQRTGAGLDRHHARDALAAEDRRLKRIDADWEMTQSARCRRVLRQFGKCRHSGLGVADCSGLSGTICFQNSACARRVTHARHQLRIFLAETKDGPGALVPGGEHGRQLIHGGVAAAHRVDRGGIGADRPRQTWSMT